MYTFHQIGSDSVFCAGAGAGAGAIFFPRGREPELDGRRRVTGLSSKITTRKGSIVPLVCVIIMYTVFEMYKDVASSFLNAEAAGDVKRSAGRGSVTTG